MTAKHWSICGSDIKLYFNGIGSRKTLFGRREDGPVVLTLRVQSGFGIPSDEDLQSVVDSFAAEGLPSLPGVRLVPITQEECESFGSKTISITM